jgi:hypothetical protein
MPTIMRLVSLEGACACAFALMAASVALAQEGGPRGRTAPTPEQIAAREAQNAEDARRWNAAPAPSDPRDFQGVWWTRGYEFAYRPITNPPMGPAAPLAPMTPAEAASRQHRHDLEAAGTPLADASNDCYPLGVPSVMAWPYPIQIDYLPGEIVFLHEVQHNVRLVHMDSGPVPADEPLTYQGYSRGRWEGNTLVIDSDHFNDKTQIDEDGLSHGLKLKVHEEITKFTNRYGGVELRDLITIDDPDHYTHPWTAERLYPWRGDVTLTEYVCEENNRNRSANGLIQPK